MEQSLFKNCILVASVLFFLSGCSILGIQVGKDSDKGAENLERRNLGGIFKTINKGSSFSHKAKVSDKKNIAKLDIAEMAFDPQETLTLYVIIKRHGLWVSYNGGESFEQIFSEPITALAIDPKQREVIYIGAGQVVRQSVNGGSSWKNIFLLKNTASYIQSIAVDPIDTNHLISASRNGFIFETRDRGVSWRKLQELKLKTLKTVLIDSRNPDILYIATSLEGILKSTDRGKTWSVAESLKQYEGANDLGQLKLNPQNPQQLFLASTHGLLRSEDGGSTWSVLPLLTPVGSVKIQTVAFNPYNTEELYYATSDALFISSDGGLAWTVSPLPTTRRPVQILLDDFDPNILYIGVTSD